MKCLVGILSTFLLSGCAASGNYKFHQYTVFGGVKSKSLERLKWENQFQPGEDITKALILQMDHASAHLIQIKGSERKHTHYYHDLIVILQSGQGRMFLGKSSFAAGAGDIIFIPKGVDHYFINGSENPATAIAVYSPVFKGEDVVEKE